MQAFEGIGHEVVARSGEDALRHQLRDDFAAILLDLYMPDMDGYERPRIIRGPRTQAIIPIVFLSAVPDEAHLLQAYSMGAVDGCSSRSTRSS